MAGGDFDEGIREIIFTVSFFFFFENTFRIWRLFRSQRSSKDHVSCHGAGPASPGLCWDAFFKVELFTPSFLLFISIVPIFILMEL
ncbi:hypothetical protein DsansV1_C09g0094131 [Dioscorea sansibarensis]